MAYVSSRSSLGFVERATVVLFHSAQESNVTVLASCLCWGWLVKKSNIRRLFGSPPKVCPVDRHSVWFVFLAPLLRGHWVWQGLEVITVARVLHALHRGPLEPGAECNSGAVSLKRSYRTLILGVG